ncbi:MAG: DUF3883 domain-containing protein [Clostridia bacterium]|nr:DUF3883 domain-containing protein [Clostridia bacterium]
MIEISQNIFEIVFSGFNKLSTEKVDESKIEFKNHPIVVKHENYKYEIIEDAKSQLLLKTWRETDIGSGTILKNVKNAINVKSNNLIDWRKKDDFKKLKANRENEKFLYDFFKSKIKEEIAFDNFVEIGFSYQLIAYLFFIKNHQKYMPISQEKFDEIFNSINIDFKTSHNCSWENYIEFNEIIKLFRKQLSQRFKNASLLDAHSFLWIYGFQLDEPKEKVKQEKPTQKSETKAAYKSKEKPKPELETYTPKKVVDLDDLTETANEIDYIENHRKLMEIGNLAEKIVLESEIEFLKDEYPELAEKVRLVSNNPELGFDVLSFESDGKQKQIEVKAISVNRNAKSFIITRNEFSKSKTYSNYYVYCVTELNSGNPKILRIKNPDFENNKDFLIESLTYKVTFE